MPTHYTVQLDVIDPVNEQSGSEIDGRISAALSRETRRGAFVAADVLFDAFGEGTEIRMAWDFRPHDTDAAGEFE